MKKLPFKQSQTVSLGIELEYQIINPQTYDLMSRAKDLLRNIKESAYQKLIKPEVTQSMIEINSSIHQSALELLKELLAVRDFLLVQSEQIGINISGSGTHPFQKWRMQKFFPSQRFKSISKLYRYLSKRSTIFGLHVHVGCSSPEDALYLTHALTRYVPQLIAMSASSPFYQGVDTGYSSSRSNDFSAFPTSGHIPFLKTWEEFSEYYYKMKSLGIIKSMKDFYWDIRPKPEFGTVEIRVCDTPLTIKKAVEIAAYVQTLAHYLLTKKPITITQDLYYVYRYNRFQAGRYGFDADFIDPQTLQHIPLMDDILTTFKLIEHSANHLKNMGLMSQLFSDVINKNNDATLLRDIYQKTHSYLAVMQQQCLMWKMS